MDKEYIENKYFDDAIRDLILTHHNFTLKSIERNVCVNGRMETETDVIMYCETDIKALPRKIGIELKENPDKKLLYPSSFCSIPLSVDDVLKVKNEMS